MNHKPLLLEIGVEELPAREVVPAVKQLGEKVRAWLDDKGLSYEKVETYATPRRLAVIVEALAVKQPDVTAEVRGPAKRIAMDASGEWTKAALGFARGQGVEAQALQVKHVGDVEYIFANTFTAGKETISLLPELKDIVTSLNFSKNMRWHTYDLRYARPIQWLVALYGEDVVPFSITAVSTNRHTKGHRFLGEEVTLHSPDEYVEKLEAQYVMVDVEKRKSRICMQLEQLMTKNGWHIPIDKALLEEVTNLVEYPTALAGQFDEAFLSLPKEVLVTTMREHQRYFPVTDANGQLLPYFVTIRNGNDASIAQVVKGNEKVLRARLADAKFFYEEDGNLSIEDALAKLDHIVFHESVGTIGEKVARTTAIATWLAAQSGLSEAEQETVRRAAAMSKFDLVTNMVGEFPELQGRMGQVYALKAGEAEAVATAIYEQYLPRFAKDVTPTSAAGTMLALADRLDTLVSCFGIGLIPTGSQDPYALRRQASGVVYLLLAYKSRLHLDTLLDYALEVASKEGFMTTSVEETKETLLTFFETRLKYAFTEAGNRYDVVDAVLQAPQTDVETMLAKSQLLTEKVDDATFKKSVEAFRRVTNLATKATHDEEVSNDLFENESESMLCQATLKVEKEMGQALAARDVKAAFASLTACEPAIAAFFADTMVMCDDARIRHNRLALLRRLAQSIEAFADFQQLVLPT
ncbi:glycine--tRNA ligase subunit beta [Bacillus sp. FSL W7-1360]